ncbi:hypothetical protein [Jannaschia formosa]|uniref:hypothetical protein n=1 Tax=Jannaschia formosa TaxID=2259592 RepID=UPI000E1B5E30|nr:hypothetical protein [Jannaschia formosa]TFL18301.1 hypothetical protein DR046_09385 [Jannaschia formosa]
MLPDERTAGLVKLRRSIGSAEQWRLWAVLAHSELLEVHLKAHGDTQPLDGVKQWRLERGQCWLNSNTIWDGAIASFLTL